MTSYRWRHLAPLLSLVFWDFWAVVTPWWRHFSLFSFVSKPIFLFSLSSRNQFRSIAAPIFTFLFRFLRTSFRLLYRAIRLFSISLVVSCNFRSDLSFWNISFFSSIFHPIFPGRHLISLPFLFPFLFHLPYLAASLVIVSFFHLLFFSIIELDFFFSFFDSLPKSLSSSLSF